MTLSSTTQAQWRHIAENTQQNDTMQNDSDKSDIKHDYTEQNDSNCDSTR